MVATRGIESDRADDGDVRRAPIDLELGEIIAGKYSIERLLGRGGMGAVWLCTHLGLGERVAVKVMSRRMANNAEVRARFEREARASAKIKSRYVARVYDTGELTDLRPYIVMEYMEGETLGQALKVVPTKSLADTARILGQVGRGLARAHELGIIHRDIKPDNVFLAHTSDDGVIAKVFDFGIVKVSDTISAEDDATQEGALLGTPQYMSPEQVEGVTIDLRSDVYSLGVMAFRMLAGKRLFPGESLSATLMKICSGPLPSLTEVVPGLPPAVDTWFLRTCARDPAQRYGSALECVDALARAAGIVATPDVSVPPPAPSTVSAVTSPPLETPSELSAAAARASAHRADDSAPPPQSTRVEAPRSRRKVVVLAATVIAGLLALLIVSKGARAPDAVAGAAATSVLEPLAPARSQPPAPIPSALPPPPPLAVALPAPGVATAAQPDAATHAEPHGCPPPPSESRCGLSAPRRTPSLRLGREATRRTDPRRWLLRSGDATGHERFGGAPRERHQRTRRPLALAAALPRGSLPLALAPASVARAAVRLRRRLPRASATATRGSISPRRVIARARSRSSNARRGSTTLQRRSQSSANATSRSASS